MTMLTLPNIKHIYQNHILDSTRWDHYTPRNNDIIIATSLKSGTTWMQNIVMHLILQTLEPQNLFDISPWLENHFMPINEVVDRLNAQEHRRTIKTHLPLDGLPYHSQVKYIVVGRDARDVFMSLWNHHHNDMEKSSESIVFDSGFVSKPLPNVSDDIREFWKEWITRGWFEWENEGYPYWSNLRHTQSWWDYRHLSNILFIHYNDLLTDLEGEIRRIAIYLEIDISEDILPQIVDAVTFKSMKKQAKEILPDLRWLRGGATTFINKGINGRWRDVLTEEDLKLYHDAIARELTPDCAQWLQNGRLSDLP